MIKHYKIGTDELVDLTQPEFDQFEHIADYISKKLSIVNSVMTMNEDQINKLLNFMIVDLDAHKPNPQFQYLKLDSFN